MSTRRGATGARATVALVVSVVMAVAVTVPALADGSAEVTVRVGADEPRASAIALSQVTWADDAAGRVVLTRDDAFPDALAGTALLDAGPMLLTPTAVLPADVRAELDRVLPDGGRVYVLGGTAAVSASISDNLSADGYDVVRLAGAGRIQTALRIAEEVRSLGGSATDVAVARAYGPATDPHGTAAWADAVSAGAWLAQTRTPLVLTPTDTLDDEVAGFLDRNDTAYFLGGEAALSASVYDAVVAITGSARRAAGADRAGTAMVVARVQADRQPGSGTWLVMNGWSELGWAFGLPAAGYAASLDASILYVSDGGVPESTSTLLSRCDDKGVTTLVVGGVGEVPDAVADQVEALDGRDCTTEAGAGGARVLVVHAVPSDAEELDGLTDAIRHEVGLMRDWFEEQSGGTGRPRTENRESDGLVAVPVVHLDATTDEVRSPAAMAQALRDVGFGDDDDAYLVYADVAADACGSSNAVAAVLWMPTCDIYPSATTTAFPYGATYLAAHELTHVLGAVASCAPNAGNGGHVVDDPRDLLYAGPQARDWDNLMLDPGNDDYFRTGRDDCADIADSPWWDGQ